jgi:hypothetical protein
MRSLIRACAIVLALTLFAVSPTFAARTWIIGSGWEGYGAPNPINGGSSDFFYPYQIAYPNCFSINTITNPPWDPMGVGGTDHFLYATTGSGCSTIGANPAQGVYFRENAPHRGHDVAFWFKRTASITTRTYIFRLNDSTHQPNTGVYRGAIDYATMSIDSSQNVSATGVSSTYASDTNWHLYEWCHVAGINGSSTIPTAAAFWVDGVSIGTGTPATTAPNIGGGDTLTFDYEFGGGGDGEFGPWIDYDPGSSCPATPLATFYYVAAQPTSNGAVQFTPSAGANWQNAAATPPGSAGYNASATVGQKDIYNLSLPTFGTGTILGVTTRASVEKDAGGTRVALPLYNNGSTTSLCSPANGFSLGGDTLGFYTAAALQIGTYQSIMCSTATDPFTSGAWTPADAAKVGIQVLR